jgi:hypothetical protein
MYKSIILSSCLCGSVYIFSKSLEFLNKSLENDKKWSYKVVINGLTFIVTGSLYMYNVQHIINYCIESSPNKSFFPSLENY